MSSSGSIEQYFCHQCNRTVTLTPSSELICPNCTGTFLEQIENPNPNSDPNPNFLSLLEEPLSNSPLSGHRSDVPNFFSDAGMNEFHSNGFNPVSAFLQNYINTLRSGGANSQFFADANNVFSNSVYGGDLSDNVGDYFTGPDFEQLIQHLGENDPNRYGTPPAARSVIEALPHVKISEEMVSECPVCKDSFRVGDYAKVMPCKHLYHFDCIITWLKMHNSCPVCRFELPTDDLEYENRGTEGIGEGLRENVETTRGVERRLRMEFPWEVGMSGEGSSSRYGNSGGVERRLRMEFPWEVGMSGEGSSSRYGNSGGGGRDSAQGSS